MKIQANNNNQNLNGLRSPRRNCGIIGREERRSLCRGCWGADRYLGCENWPGRVARSRKKREEGGPFVTSEWLAFSRASALFVYSEGEGVPKCVWLNSRKLMGGILAAGKWSFARADKFALAGRNLEWKLVGCSRWDTSASSIRDFIKGARHLLSEIKKVIF